MVKITRSSKNPILKPIKSHVWESLGAFNGCPVILNDKYYLLYRALSTKKKISNIELELSTIGMAQSKDGINFSNRKQIIIPQEDWEKYGCEDPRITYLDGKFYIFYTALSNFPFDAAGIRIGLAITTDFKKFEKHLITPFNAKAMTLFPQKINGKYTAILTANTDNPPAKIAIAQADNIEDFWNYDYWDNWYMFINNNTLPLLRSQLDHLEVGSPPVLTEKGWIIFYSYIKDYQTSLRSFNIEALLLDKNNPMKILGSIRKPILYPEKPYEKKGVVPNIVFPSGALISKDKLYIYYGAADTVCAMASCLLKNLLEEFEK